MKRKIGIKGKGFAMFSHLIGSLDFKNIESIETCTLLICLPNVTASHLPRCLSGISPFPFHFIECRHSAANLHLSKAVIQYSSSLTV